jgi:tetratricopeptide (TPR) repeat protein
LDAVRHTYLHFVLDPIMLKKAYMLRKLQPLLAEVQAAPLDRIYKADMELLTTESIIRAIEARVEHPGKSGEAARNQALDQAMTHGFILARYFDDSLAKFEEGQVGLREALPDWLFFLNVNNERKRVQNIAFASQGVPEVVSTAPRTRSLLDMAEQRIASGDYTGAGKLAQQALDQKQGDAGQAYFLLAQAATMNNDAEGARNYFERTLQAASDPRIVAWSHIYLGRMADMQSDRETALQHYQAALKSGDLTADTKAAAERGLKEPYEPQRPPQ